MTAVGLIGCGGIAQDVLAALHPQGFDALSGGPEVFASIIQSEIKRWGEVAQAAGLKK